MDSALSEDELLAANTVIDLDADETTCPACQSTIQLDKLECPECGLRFGA